MQSNYFKGIFKGQSRGAKAKRQVLYSILIQGLSIIIGLLYVPLLLNYLSQEKYGIWLTLTSILGWFSFFDIGIGNGLRNKLTEVFARNEFGLGKKLVSTTYFLLICIFSVVLVLFHISNFFLDWNLILNTKTIDSRELHNLVSIVFTFFILRFIVQIISVVYLADQKPSATKMMITAGNLFSYIIILILTRISINQSLLLVGVVISSIPVVVFIVASVISFNTRYKKIKPSIKFIDFKVSNGILDLGVKFLISQIAYIILITTSNFFIAQFYGPAEVTVYNIAFKYFQLPVMIYSILLSPIWSAVTDAYVRTDFQWIKKTVKIFNLLSVVFAIGIVLMIVISNWMYKIWIGDKIIIPIHLSIAIGVNTIIQIFLLPYSAFINGMGKLNLTVLISFFEVIIYLLLVFIFANYFTSSVGIVLAIAMTTLLSGFVQPLQTHKLLNKTAKGIWNK
jgi:O-antigen/teichoic acid export membrane protein